jgi:hypothetical protein
MARQSTLLPRRVGSALLTLAIGPVALVLAWSSGYRAPLPWVAVALAPGVLSGLVALWSDIPAPRVAIRNFAHGLFHSVARSEHHLVARGGRLGSWLASPLRDLHTGDAQEYLLFLVGLSVLMLLLPILQ